MPQVKIIAKNFMDMVASLPAMKLDALYRNQFICEAILRSMPPLAKKYVLQMLYIDVLVTSMSLMEWVPADGKSKHEVAIDRLIQLRVFQVIDRKKETTYKLNSTFQTNLRKHLISGGNLPREPIPPNVIGRLPTSEELDAYAHEQWECFLLQLISSGQTERSTSFSSSMMRIFQRGLLRQREKEAPKLTESGFQFLLMDTNAQLWYVIREYISNSEEQGVDQADLIAFLLELSFHTAGEAYNLDTLTDDQTTMIKDLADLGLVKLQKGRKESWFIPTKLATNLSVSLTDSSSRKHRLNHGQKTDKSSSYARLAELSSSRRLNLSRSWSCRADVMGDTSSPYADEEYFEITPSNGLEKIFPGRPQGYLKTFPLLNFGANNGVLSRNDSQSSFGSASIMTSADEDITSIHTFVAGLKKQLANGQVQSTGLEADESGKSMRDVGLDPMYDGSSTPLHWSREFERLQRAILELWQACNISLVHRTYFFLLFKGDSADSIYMEVELRRLTFLKETFSQGNQAVEDGRTLTLASSVRSLRRERQTLSKLLRKRFTEEEREKLYKKWGIELNSKQRRLQLVNQLWSNNKDMVHVKDSAAIVAKLIRFVEQGKAMKEMFGLSFTAPRPRRRSYGWKNSMASLL